MAKPGKAPKQKGGLLGGLLKWGRRAKMGADVVRHVADDEQREQMLAVAKDPKQWGETLKDGWDAAKIEAVDTKDAFGILGRVALGEDVSKAERKACASQLGDMGLFIPPLRVFSIPGSWILLGVAAKVTPWHLVPDVSLPKPDLLGRLRDRFGDGDVEEAAVEGARAADVIERHPEELED